jgi:hypothetical protein
MIVRLPHGPSFPLGGREPAETMVAVTSPFSQGDGRTSTGGEQVNRPHPLAAGFEILPARGSRCAGKAFFPFLKTRPDGGACPGGRNVRGERAHSAPRLAGEPANCRAGSPTGREGMQS